MLEVFEESRLASLVVLFVMSFNIGAMVGYGTWQNEIKDVFLLSQTQGIYPPDYLPTSLQTLLSTPAMGYIVTMCQQGCYVRCQ